MAVELMMQQENSLLPVFMVVGAQKAGTTTLDRWLRDYPEISLPKGKETHFFSDPDKFSRGREWYLKQFPDYRPGQIRGEVAPQYMYSMEAPIRIGQSISSPRFVFLLRHPIDRAYSHYLMSVRQGVENLSFTEALTKEGERLAGGGEFERNHFGYMARSRYSEQIGRYMEQFPDSPMHFALFEDLMDAGELGDKTYADIVTFIGLDYFLPPNRAIKENEASQPRLRVLRDLLYGSSGLKRWLRLLIPSRDLREQLAYRVDKLNQKPLRVEKPGVSANTIEACVAETLGTAKITGLNMDKWHGLTAKYKLL